MKTLSYDQLKKMIDDNQNFLLVDVLPKDSFEKAHISDAVNIPLSETDFVNQVEQAAGNKNRKVVVYCASSECPASHNAAEKLDEAGFKDVSAYEGGIREWLEKSGPSGKSPEVRSSLYP